MLSIDATNDKELLDNLSLRAFGKNFDGKAGFVLFIDSQPIGVAKVTATDNIASISQIGVVPEERGKGYGDFFTRALMHNLSNASEKIVVESVCNYFLKFGFEQQANKMVIDSKDLVFPRKCCHCS